MKFYKTKIKKIPGTDYREINFEVKTIRKQIEKKSKRRVHIRSVYFNKSKIFLDTFWSHLNDTQNWRDRVRRLKFLPCAIDLIQNSRINPESMTNPNKQSEILHRFYGVTSEDEKFCVQIKENKRTNEKYFLSVFPYDNK